MFLALGHFTTLGIFRGVERPIERVCVWECERERERVLCEIEREQEKVEVCLSANCGRSQKEKKVVVWRRNMLLFSRSLSLSLSLSHTHTHTYTLMHRSTHKLTLFLWLSNARRHTHTFSLQFSSVLLRSNYHTSVLCCWKRFFARILFPPLSLSLSLSLSFFLSHIFLFITFSTFLSRVANHHMTVQQQQQQQQQQCFSSSAWDVRTIANAWRPFRAFQPSLLSLWLQPTSSELRRLELFENEQLNWCSERPTICTNFDFHASYFSFHNEKSFNYL